MSKLPNNHTFPPRSLHIFKQSSVTSSSSSLIPSSIGSFISNNFLHSSFLWLVVPFIRLTACVVYFSTIAVLHIFFRVRVVFRRLLSLAPDFSAILFSFLTVHTTNATSFSAQCLPSLLTPAFAPTFFLFERPPPFRWSW